MISSFFKKKAFLFPLLVAFLAIPSFYRILRPGIFSMHDFHIFRLFEFHRCVQDLQIPCRWAPDATFGYGQPVFNFYTQVVYMIGEPFLLAGLQVIDTVKLLFIISLVGSALSMFFLARQVWGSNWAGVLSASLYVYAPYRAVDVFVRGSLPEAFSFVFFPLIVLFFNRYVLGERIRDLLLMSMFAALLLLTHNLSSLMFSIFLGVWAIYFLTIHKKWVLIKNLIFGGVLTAALSGFYLLPVLLEKKLTALGQFTQGYYNFQIHFTTLKQLFILRIWDYGASQWGTDDPLSFSIGHVQWIFSLLLIGYIALSRKIRKNLAFIVIVAIGWFALFLTHGRSVFLWDLFPPISYVQFPWRFLSIATFSLALAGGAVFLFLKSNKWRTVFLSGLVLLVIVVNFQFFKEDIWHDTTDKEQLSGEIWEWHTSSSREDFWPKYAESVPDAPAPDNPIFLSGEGEVVKFRETSKSMSSEVVVASKEAEIQFPLAYFDGWKGSVDSVSTEIYPEGVYGQVTILVPKGTHVVDLIFTNTPIRTIGNLVTVFAVLFWVWLFLGRRYFKK